MNTTDKRRYEMLIRVRNFGQMHAQLFPATSTAHAAFADLAAEVDHLQALDVTARMASHSASGARKAAARDSLIECLMRAKNTARILAKTNPQLEGGGVELPDPVDDLLLLTIARQFTTTVAADGQQFTTHGMPLDDLQRRIDAFDTALNERGMQHDEREQARAGIEASLTRALAAVETLDVTVANHLAGDPVRLAAWKRDRRVWRAKRSRSSIVPGPRPPGSAPAEPAVTPPEPVFTRAEPTPATPVSEATNAPPPLRSDPSIHAPTSAHDGEQ